MSNELKHALIIGGTGFISTHCCEIFANAGYAVTIMTRGSTPDVHGNLVKTRLKVDCDKRSKFVASLKNSLKDMSKDQQLANVPSKWDAVVDFICFDDSHAEDIVKGLSNLTKIFVFISTDSVYEVCKPQPGMNDPDFKGRSEEFDETLDKDHDALMDIDSYGYTKLLAEKVFRAAPDLPYCALRLPDVMGEREYPRCRHFQYQFRVMMGLPVYINPSSHGYHVSDYAAPEGVSLPASSALTTPSSPSTSLSTLVAPPPAAKRLSFVYAGDVGQAALCLATQAGLASQGLESQWHELSNHAFNIGSPEKVTLEQYVGIIAETLGKQAFFFSSGPQRLRTIRYSQFVHSHAKNNTLVPTNAAFSYSRIVDLLRCSVSTAAAPALGRLAGVLSTAETDALLSKAGLRPWGDAEGPEVFTRKLIEKGFELDSDSDSDSDDDSDTDSEPEAADFGSRYAANDSKSVLQREKREDDDMYSYLPSVDQGHVSIDKARKHIPGWSPTPLREWCARMTAWYAHQSVLEVTDIDARNRILKMLAKKL